MSYPLLDSSPNSLYRFALSLFSLDINIDILINSIDEELRHSVSISSLDDLEEQVKCLIVPWISYYPDICNQILASDMHDLKNLQNLLYQLRSIIRNEVAYINYRKKTYLNSEDPDNISFFINGAILLTCKMFEDENFKRFRETLINLAPNSEIVTLLNTLDMYARIADLDLLSADF